MVAMKALLVEMRSMKLKGLYVPGGQVGKIVIPATRWGYEAVDSDQEGDKDAPGVSSAGRDA